MNFNTTIIEGCLLQDPIFTGNSLLTDNICTFTIKAIANNCFYNFDIITHHKLASHCFKNLKKGSRVLVSGIKVNTTTIDTREVNYLGDNK